MNATLRTSRLVLEPMGARHADHFFLPLQDDALYQWISMDKPPSLEWLQARWLRNECRLSPDGQFAWLAWAVRREDDGVYLGRVDAEVNEAQQATNVGYYLFPPHWRQGYAGEAVIAVTRHLVAHSVQRLAATVTAGNTASVRVLQKAGYSFTRTLPGNDVVRGVAVDDEEYVITV